VPSVLLKALQTLEFALRTVSFLLACSPFDRNINRTKGSQAVFRILLASCPVARSFLLTHIFHGVHGSIALQAAILQPKRRSVLV